MSHKPLTYAEIYRQIAIIGVESCDFPRLKVAVAKILEGVQYVTLAEVPELRLIAIQLAPGEDVLQVLEDLRAATDVESAERNQVVRPSFVDDPLYRQQWALERIGAEPAWQHALATLNLAAPGVVVAIVDSGIHSGHPDLANHLWDDGAGNHGLNVLTNTFDVSDRDGHGTLLAGTVGAISNNTQGIAAAGWPVRLMAMKFIDTDIPPTSLYGALGIFWAAFYGAQVIVAAWGLATPFPALAGAIAFAQWKGAIVIAAAGNDGLDNDVFPTYPASYNAPPFNAPPFNLHNIVSVMASKRPDYNAIVAGDLRDDKAWFSNYGRATVHLAAPGIDVLTTGTHFATPPWLAYGGTSAACAHVAYAATLLKALNPLWTPIDIRDHLVASVDWSPWLACISRGRLSLDRAVRGPFVITAPRAGARWPVGANVQVTWNRRYRTPRARNVRILLSRNGGAYVPIAVGQPNNGGCRVTAPNVPVANARVRVQSEEGPGLYSVSEPFTVQ
jgi:subtilisin family serine protease